MQGWRIGCVLVGVVCSGIAGQVARAEESRQEAAVEAAQTWLVLVDTGDYAQSWETAAEFFKGAVAKEQWGTSLTGVRGPLGALVSRAVHSAQYATELPGAPDGEYVVIQFESAFEEKRSAAEMVTPMREQDGTWRVAGYYIR